VTTSNKMLAMFYLFIWVVLIVAGIVAKRVYGHPDWMMFFHLPAAVFLVMGMRTLSTDLRKKYLKEISDYRRKPDLDQGRLN
jgi:hypothetical protein